MKKYDNEKLSRIRIFQHMLPLHFNTFAILFHLKSFGLMSLGQIGEEFYSKMSRNSLTVSLLLVR